MDNPLSLNRYTYTENNPIRYTDPTGNAPDKEAHGYDDSKLHYIYKSTKDMSLFEALGILTSNKYSKDAALVAQGVVTLSVLGPDGGSKWFRNIESALFTSRSDNVTFD